VRGDLAENVWIGKLSVNRGVRAVVRKRSNEFNARFFRFTWFSAVVVVRLGLLSRLKDALCIEDSDFDTARLSQY
jgi:hypothetical protein